MKKTPDWLIKIMKKMKLKPSGNDTRDREKIAAHIGEKTIAESMGDHIKRSAEK